jgi:hypothetical protein
MLEEALTPSRAEARGRSDLSSTKRLWRPYGSGTPKGDPPPFYLTALHSKARARARARAKQGKNNIDKKREKTQAERV